MKGKENVTLQKKKSPLVSRIRAVLALHTSSLSLTPTLTESQRQSKPVLTGAFQKGPFPGGSGRAVLSLSVPARALWS